MQAALPLIKHKPWRQRWFPNGEWVLLVALAAETAIFAVLGEEQFPFEPIQMRIPPWLPIVLCRHKGRGNGVETCFWLSCPPVSFGE